MYRSRASSNRKSVKKWGDFLMSFNITLYKNLSEPNRIDKTLEQVTSQGGTLKDESSILSPSVIFEGNLLTVSRANYMYIDSFNRYYFITNITSYRNRLILIEATVDVLMSFKSQIRANYGIINKQEYNYNLYLDDGSLRFYQNPVVQTKKFPNAFGTEEFVLVVGCPSGQ